MRIIDTDPKRLIFEGRRLPQRAWLVWTLLFFPGLLALLLLPEANRFIALVVWIAIWLGLFALMPRWLGEVMRVTVDANARAITWASNAAVTRTVPFIEVTKFEAKSIATNTRPYKAFQLVALLKNGTHITLAVSPAEAEIKHALELARSYLKKR
jgi:hypothetical protein